MQKEHKCEAFVQGGAYEKRTRPLTFFWSEPACGINADTGIVVVCHGLGGRQNDITYKKIRRRISQEHNLIVMGVNYAGTDVLYMDEQHVSDALIKNAMSVITPLLSSVSLRDPNHIFIRPDLLHYYPNPLCQAECEKPFPDDYWDYGFLQACDVIFALQTILRMIGGPQRAIHLISESAGSQVAMCALKLAPQVFSSWLDLAGILFSLAMKETLVEMLCNPFGQLHFDHRRMISFPIPGYETKLYFRAKSPVGFPDCRTRGNTTFSDEVLIRTADVPEHFTGLSDLEIEGWHGDDDTLSPTLIKKKIYGIFLQAGAHTTLNLVDRTHIPSPYFHSSGHDLVADRLKTYCELGAALWKRSQKRQSRALFDTEPRILPVATGNWSFQLLPQPTIRFHKKSSHVPDHIPDHPTSPPRA